jgi:MYXO-CTERM domain-containing protein
VNGRAAAAAIALALAVAAAPPARAYVREVSDQPPHLPVYWASPCVVATIYMNGFTEMSSDEVAKSIGAAAQAWSPDTVTCPGTGSDVASGHPSFEIITQMSTGGPVPALDGGADGKNSIIFRTTDWILEKPEAIALTSRNTDPSGRIFDADIEINAVPVSVDSFRDFRWANLDPGSPGGGHSDAIDLQTAITHEFGHFLGLSHTCFSDGDTLPRPLDDQGQAIPDCIDGSNIPEAAAVMWYAVDRNSTSKRVITPDDTRGVCAIYPPTTTPAVCALNVPDDGCGCRAGGTRPAAGSALLLALGALVGARRRRSS